MAIEPYGSLVGGSNIVVSKAAEEIVIDSPEQDPRTGQLVSCRIGAIII